jgi:hypothetical protein
VKDTADYSSRDNDARCTFYVHLWKRSGITLEQFDEYWHNVHGPVCARLPGQFQYWQFSVAHNEGGIFPAVPGVDLVTAPEDQFDGIAELTYKTTQDRQAWMAASTILMDDEHNIFRKAIGYVTDQGNSRTYVDRIEVGDPNGRLGVVKFHVMVRQADGIGVGDFRKYLTDRFAAKVTGSPHLLKFRLHLFEPPDVSRPAAPGVSHSEPADRQYQAAFEVGFRDRLAMEDFFASDQYAAAVEDQAKYVKRMAPFPERDTYTFVYGGKMTLAGQRGSRTAALITGVGARNQVRDDVLDLVLGKGVR